MRSAKSGHRYVTTVEDIVYLTTNQRSGNDSPRFMGINSRWRCLCPLDVD